MTATALAPPHCEWYPEEKRETRTKNCAYCGRFLAWNDYYGRWVYHGFNDYEYGWQVTCE